MGFPKKFLLMLQIKNILYGSRSWINDKLSSGGEISNKPNAFLAIPCCLDVSWHPFPNSAEVPVSFIGVHYNLQEAFASLGISGTHHLTCPETVAFFFFKNPRFFKTLVVQWLRLCLHCWGPGFNPCLGNWDPASCKELPPKKSLGH